MAPAAAEHVYLYDCPANCKPAEDDRGNCPLIMAAYILAGLAMMLNIRLSYSSAPYALIRFRLPENLFSVFVRRMASSLELWCLPGFIIADAIELAVKLLIKFAYKDHTLDSKKLKFYAIIVPSIIAQWLNFLTYVILFFVYLAGDDHGRLTTFYWTIAVSGFVFGINNPLVFAADYNYIPIYIAGENCFPALTSLIHYFATLIFGNRRKWDSDFLIVYIDIFVAIIISLVAAVLWTIAYGVCRDVSFDGKITYTTPKDIKSIIITGIPTTNLTEGESTTKTIDITGGKVTIYNGTLSDDGKTCTNPTTPTAKEFNLASATKATITVKDNTATLTIPIPPDTATDALNALANLAIPHSCSVEVSDNKLTIEPDAAKDGAGRCKFIDIEITLDSAALTTELGLENGTTTANVNVDPPPNHLNIQYQTTTGREVKKAAYIPEDAAQKIAQEIKKTAQEIIATPSAETYYYVTDPETNITYSFKLDEQQANQLTTGKTAIEKTAITVEYGHIFAEGFGDTSAKPYMIAPLLIVLVGMGLVYAIYPGIAPGMIVPFYLIDKIEMVLLIATIFPPIIISILRRTAEFKDPRSPLCEWGPENQQPWPGGKAMGQGFHWHLFDLIVPIMIILAYIFIYSLHYRESNISRSIINQPKMSTALTIVFYMCHEISLAVGFAGMVGNGAEYTVLAQMVGAFLMVFLALYSEGYIIEYKSHDPAHWPTEGMTKWNAFCYWCKRASKITNHNLRSLFTTDLRRDLLLCIQKNELI